MAINISSAAIDFIRVDKFRAAMCHNLVWLCVTSVWKLLCGYSFRS